MKIVRKCLKLQALALYTSDKKYIVVEKYFFFYNRTVSKITRVYMPNDYARELVRKYPIKPILIAI